MNATAFIASWFLVVRPAEHACRVRPGSSLKFAETPVRIERSEAKSKYGLRFDFAPASRSLS